MPLFYFHMRSDAESIRDDEGIPLPDIDAVREEAIAAAREIMAQRLISDGKPDGYEFVVEDESGTVVFVLPFVDALDPNWLRNAHR